MKLTQRCVVPVPPEQLWELLVDVSRAGPCIPGVEGIEPLGDDKYRGVLTVQVGPIRLTLEGMITVEERDRDAWRASMRAEANDRGASGGIRARMSMRLSPAEGGTEITVETDLSVLGKIGEFGQPIIKKKADGIMQEFAQNLAMVLRESKATRPG